MRERAEGGWPERPGGVSAVSRGGEAWPGQGVGPQRSWEGGCTSLDWTMGRWSAGAEALRQVEAPSAPTPSLGPWNKAAVGVARVPFIHSFILQTCLGLQLWVQLLHWGPKFRVHGDPCLGACKQSQKALRPQRELGSHLCPSLPCQPPMLCTPSLTSTRPTLASWLTLQGAVLVTPTRLLRRDRSTPRPLRDP